jgi:hypothetical protein
MAPMVRQATCAKHMASMLEETPTEPRCHLCPLLSRRGRIVGAHGCLAGKRRQLPAWLERRWLTPHPCNWKARQSVSSQTDAGPANIGPALQAPPGSVSIVQGSEAGTRPGPRQWWKRSDPELCKMSGCSEGGGAAPTVVPAPYRSPSISFSNLENIAQCRPVARRRFGCVTQAPAEDLICTHTNCKLHRQTYHAF